MEQQLSNTLLLTQVIAYKTRRYHYILCENSNVLRDICELRFGYAMHSGEPEWGITKTRVIPQNVADQMIYGNLCPRCNEWHKKDFNCNGIGVE